MKDTKELEKPSAWPNANQRLLGLGAGLPVDPLVRLKNFSPEDFERFVLEWAHGYLSRRVEIVEVQQRGGAGDKGRDIIAWLDQPSDSNRRWYLFQCKRYSAALGPSSVAGEVAKVLYYAQLGDYRMPSGYWFVSLKGVTGNAQDLIDAPDTLRDYILTHWDKHCAPAISAKRPPELSSTLSDFIQGQDLSIVRVKQPLDLLNEHGQTKYHPRVFGVPLVDRPPPPLPPSQVSIGETGYVNQLFAVFAEMIGSAVASEADFANVDGCKSLFSRSRMTFYSAEGLKELARDQMDDAAHFQVLLEEFKEGLYHTYTGAALTGLDRLRATVTAAQQQQLSEHLLKPLVTPTDREGICHHLANEGTVTWCK